MKRYLLFGSPECYYASGGIHDFIGHFGNLNAAITCVNDCRDGTRQLDWWHVYDAKKGMIVAGSIEQAYNAEHLENCRLYKIELTKTVELSPKEVWKMERLQIIDSASKKASESRKLVQDAINASFEG